MIQKAEPAGSCYFTAEQTLAVGGWSDISVWKMPGGILLNKYSGTSGFFAFSGGNRFFRSDYNRNCTEICDLSSGQVWRTFPRSFLAVAKDGSFFIAKNASNIALVRTTDGAETVLNGINEGKYMKISPCGRFVLAIEDHDLWFGSISSNKTVLKESSEHFYSRNTAEFSPDGEHVIIMIGNRLKCFATKDGSVLFDIQTTAAITDIDICEKNGDIACVFADPGKDGKIMAIFDPQSGKEISSVKGRTGLSDVFWSHGGGRIAASTYRQDSGRSVDVFLYKYDARTLNYLNRINVRAMKWTNSITFSADDAKYAFAYGEHGSSPDFGVIMCDASDGSVLRKVSGKRADDGGMACSSDGKYFATGGFSQTINIFRTSDFSLVRSLSMKNYVLPISIGGGFVSVYEEANGIRIFSIGTGEEVRSFRKSYQFIISPDGGWAVSDEGRNSPASIRTLPDFTVKTVLRKSENQSFSISPSGRYLASFISDAQTRKKIIRIWKSSDGGVLKEFSVPGEFPSYGVALRFSHDDRFLVYGSSGISTADSDRIFVWDIVSGNILRKIRIPAKHESSPIEILPNGVIVTASHYDHTIRLWDLSSGQQLKSIESAKSVDSIAYSPDGALLYVNGSDGMQIINLSNGNRAHLIAEKGEWILYTDDGYFDASGDGGRFLAMVNGLEGFSIDQFAVRNNRPDIIFSRLGIGSKDLLSNFRSQYSRRLKKLGFVKAGGEADESALAGDPHVPEAKIAEVRTQGKNAHLSFEFSDSRFMLKRYNLFINDVPLFGAYGKNLSGGKSTCTETVELSEGENKIEVSCMNEKGAESVRALSFVRYDKPVRSDLYFIGFGVSKYRDSSLDLRYADKDAEELAETFGRMKGSFGNVYVKAFVNEEVTVENIKKAKELLRNAGPDDTFVLFIAGHGVHDTDANSTYYYLTHDADRDKLSGTCADFDLVEDLLQGIAPRKKLFLMDTCESGEIDDETGNGYFSAAGSRGIKARTARTIVINPRRKEDKRPFLLYKDRYIYNDIVRRSGSIVFSSSKGGEFSYESDKIKNGYFTKCILDALKGKASKKGSISVDDLRKFVIETVPKETGNLQHPTVDRDNLFVKFSFPAVK
jgi:WD40 repeat protein